MPDNKRRGQHGPGGDDKRSRHRIKKHLYLVLDDWDKGYSIHKMDADDDDDDDDAEQRLPEPPALRIESPAGCTPYIDMSFAAMGTKIFALMNRRCGFVYDTETGVLGVGAQAPLHMVCGAGICVAVGGVLYALTYRYFDEQHPIDFEAMSWAPGAAVAGTMQQQPVEGWLWKSLPPPPFCRGVRSYALHPDGCTIFMTTTINVQAPVCGNPMGTYSFNTKESAWRWHGEWALPFLGRAHFDAELDAWVGLGHDGHICCCHAVSPTCYNGRVPPTVFLDCKTTKEKLFRKDQERHMTASLTYMGTSKFCLVECVSSRNLHDQRPPPDRRDDHAGYVLSVTMFGLKYDHKGELQTTLISPRTPSRCLGIDIALLLLHSGCRKAVLNPLSC